MRSKLAIRNSFFNVASLSINAVFSFVIRKYLILYLGIDILGVNAVIIDTLNTLSLAELGIQTAIAFRLYQPVAEGNERREGEIFSLFRKAYRVIGSFILIAGIGLIPFIQCIVKTEIDIYYVLAIYFIQLVAISLPYFFSYYRILFLVHQKQYFCTKIDIISHIIFSCIQIFVLVYFKSYIIYLLISYVKFFVSNGIIIKACRREFGFVKRKYIASNQDKKNLFGDLREIIWGNVAGYVYSSTDSLIISYFCGTVLVGFISNYKTVTNTVRSCINVVNTSLVPSWGNFLHSNTDHQRFKELYYMFIFLEYCVCSILLIPVLCLADAFITLWLGVGFIIEREILILIVIDIYISTIHEPNAVVMRSLGMFKEDKWNSFWATLTNLATSLILVQIYGVKGVLIGTILALIIFWVTRSKSVNTRCFGKSKKEYIYYWYKNLLYLVMFLIEYIVVTVVLKKTIAESSIWGFFKSCVICELIVMVFILCFWGRCKEMKSIIANIIKPLIRRKKDD